MKVWCKTISMTIVVLGEILLSLPGLTQQVARRVCDTIPYEFLQEKIVIPVTVNGVKVKYIVDTGGQTGTMWEEAVEMKVEATGASSSISDLNGAKQVYQKGIMKEVALSPHYTLQTLETMVLPVTGLFKSIGVVGILGGDAFAGCVVTFDARKKIMVINSPYRPEGLKVSEGVEMFPGIAHHSIVNVNIGGVEKQMLFDTGAQGFLLFSMDDYRELKGQAACQRVSGAYGIGGVGLTGLTDPVEINKVNVGELTFVGKRFTNVGSVTTPSGISIIGVDLLNHGKVVIDYLRNRFYFFPFDDSSLDMGGAPKMWNVGILPVNERFEVTTVWESLKDKVTFGDHVININGMSLEGLPMSQPVIDDLMNAIEGDVAYIVVMKEGQERKVEIRRSL